MLQAAVWRVASVPAAADPGAALSSVVPLPRAAMAAAVRSAPW